MFSIFDLEKSENQTTCWDCVRNFQARNYMRDSMKIGDKVFFYHSNSEVKGIAGVCEIASEGYPDKVQFDNKSEYFDSRSKPENPLWIMVDIKLDRIFKNFVTLQQIRENEKLRDMKLLQRNNRLSVMPVSEMEFIEIIKMSEK